MDKYVYGGGFNLNSKRGRFGAVAAIAMQSYINECLACESKTTKFKPCTAARKRWVKSPDLELTDVSPIVWKAPQSCRETCRCIVARIREDFAGKATV